MTNTHKLDEFTNGFQISQEKGIELSIVTPFFNEEHALFAFCTCLRAALDNFKMRYEVIFVDDGSSDRSQEVLGSIEWPQCKILSLLHNVGHQTALEAGYSVAQGNWIASLDADLQHPPSVIQSLYDKAISEELDVVYAVRTNRDEDTLFKRVTAKVFYRVIRWISGVAIIPNAADFRIISRRVLSIINQLPEEKVFRLLLPALGFRFGVVEFVANPRVAGSSKYSIKKMIGLALSGAIGFSLIPLRIASICGMLLSFCGFLYMFYVLYCAWTDVSVSGWASIIICILVIGGMQLFALGLLGEYVGRIFIALKQRPRFIIDSFISK